MASGKDYLTRTFSRFSLLRPRHWPHVFLAIGSAAIIGMLVISYLQFSLGLHALNHLAQYDQRIQRIDELLRLIVDAETGIRGYQLTGDKSYLVPYRSAMAKLPLLMEQVKQGSESQRGDNQAADQLVKLARREITLLQEVGAFVDLKGAANPQLIQEGKETMDAFRKQVEILRIRSSQSGQKSIDRSMALYRQSGTVTVGLSAMSLALLVTLFFASLREQRLRDQITRMLHEERESLEAQVDTRTRQLKELATYLTNAQEAERFRLARELHDELGALLTAAKLEANWLERKLPEDLKQRLAERLTRLQDTLGSGIALKRRITNDLRPALLYELGLVAALQVMADEVARCDEIEVHTDLHEGDLDLPEDVSLALFRIVQESLTNIRKYARAKRVDLSLGVAGRTIRLRVKDDGVGFDPSSPQLARHGLAGMQHRVHMLAGKLTITSSPGAGTCIEVEAPMPG